MLMIRNTIIFISILIISAATCHGAIGITDSDVDRALQELDRELGEADRYLSVHRNSLRRLSEIYAEERDTLEKVSAALLIGDRYVAIDIDSAITYYGRGRDIARAANLDSLATVSAIKQAIYLPVIGFVEEATSIYGSVDTDGMSSDMMRLYHSAGHSMFNYIASLYAGYPDVRQRYSAKARESQHNLLEFLDPDTDIYKLNRGEYYYSNGEYAKAMAILEDLAVTLPDSTNAYARTAYFLANIAKARGDANAYVYYLARSATADVKSATLEVTSLQELGARMFEHNDVDRAHLYLSQALANAVECHALTRMAQSAESLPLIEAAHEVERNSWRNRIYIVMGVLALLLVGLATLLICLRREISRMNRLQRRLRDANHVKEVYISQFMDLCSIFMDKLNQFCKIASRKISTGKTDELYRMTKSGKFVEENSREFYQIFDNAFLHIYPDFVDKVNALLRPDERIELRDGEQLNTDLRILAFMRLGIDESPKIAQVLNYSVHTIYTYRNKLKNRAVNRDTFESEVMRIGASG